MLNSENSCPPLDWSATGSSNDRSATTHVPHDHGTNDVGFLVKTDGGGRYTRNFATGHFGDWRHFDEILQGSETLVRSPQV